MKNDKEEKQRKSDHQLFKVELRAWIQKKVKDGKFKNDLAVLVYLVEKLGKHEREGELKYYCAETIRNYYYGSRWPVLPEHALIWSKVTKIKKKVFNPYTPLFK